MRCQNYPTRSASPSWALLLTYLLISACQPVDPTVQAPNASTANVREILITREAYAGSSVNVVAGSRQTLYTDGAYQYAGFYDAAGQLTLAQRRLGEERWKLEKTGYTTAVQDAHNTVSLVVDGDGYLHVAWGHHNTPLQYAVARKPGSLSLSQPVGMVGRGEASVTYPQFYRDQEGGLLFLYRDGGSGNGRLVLNRFDLESRQWQRVQDNLIDGEGERSAYWDMTIDSEGGLHLAWNWRETPDVASNHDLLYAYSPDGGQHWERSGGSPYALPITVKSAEMAAAIDQNHNLMNPPAVSIDRWNRPYLSSYWSPEMEDRPRFNLVYLRDGQWQSTAGPEAGRDFVLKGWGTKRPPISRAALLIESREGATRAHFIYRDDSQAGRVVMATARDLSQTDGAQGNWGQRFLTAEGVGAWEPSVDPVQWSRDQQVHMLVQTVDQIDGDDHSGSGGEASALRLLVWEAP